MKNQFIILLLCVLLSYISKAQNIISAEYFFDSDPGYGGAGTHSIAVTPAATVTLSFTASVSGLAPGYHWMFVRTKDAIGNISFYEPQQFYINAPIIAAEYFFDTDPGFGAQGAHSISVSPATTVDLSFSPDLEGLSPGFHWMFVRTKDVSGLVSLSEPRQFYITNNITTAEYFFDTDNGVGTGTLLDIASPAETISLSVPITPVNLEQDITHSLFVRTKDSTGKWSLYEPQNLYSCGTSVSISQGNTVTVCSGTHAPLNAVVNAADFNLQFNGSSSYVKIPDAIALHPNDFTLEAYFNASSISSSNSVLLGKRFGTTGNSYPYLIYLVPGGILHCAVNTSDFTIPGAIALNTWNHVAMVKSGTTLTIYINGVLKSTVTVVASPPYDGSTFFIGAYDNNNDGAGDKIFSGKIDEVRLWNYARTSAQITASMNTVINPVTEGLTGYWRMDDGSGTLVKDRSAGRNHGAAFGSPLWTANASPVQHAFNYSWSPATGLNVTNAAAVLASPTVTTDYTVTVTENATGCSASATITAKVLTPVASSNSPDAAPICAGNTLNLYCTGVDPGTATFSWTKQGGGFTSTEQNPAIPNASASDAGVYVVAVHDVSGCIVTAITSVVINYITIGSCPSITSFNSPGQCGANVYFPTPSATGLPFPLITVSKQSETFFDVGNTPVTVTATNVCGTVECTFNVVVTDVQPPVIMFSPSTFLFADPGLCSASSALLSQPMAFDNCGIQTVTSDAPPAIPVGITEVQWTATDIYGNTSTLTQEVTVHDNQNPTITCHDTTVNALPGYCFFYSNALNIPAVSDNCGIWSFPFNGGSLPVGTSNIQWTVTDIHGNSSSCIQHVTVVDNENPTIQCPPDITVNSEPGMCTSNVLVPPPPALDNCGVNLPTSDAPASFPVGTTEVLWTVTDIHGNAATCTSHVIVEDHEKPIIICPQDIIVNPDPGLPYASNVALGTPVTSDNCGVNIPTNDAPSTFQIGTTIVHWMVTDIHGNLAASFCYQQVTVTNQPLPTITCPGDIPVNTDAGWCFASSVILGIPSTTGSGLNPVTNDAPPNFPIGTTDVHWTVTDAYGNSATCTQHVVVFANTEICNGFDDDCDGSTDEGCGNLVETNGSWIYSNTLFDNWNQPGFNDAGWYPASELEQGFPDDPNLQAIWGDHPNGSPDIVYLRKSFAMGNIPACVYLDHFEDDDAQVYVNGNLVSNDVNSFAGPYIYNVDIKPYLIANANNVIAVKAMDNWCCHYSFALRVHAGLLKVFADNDGDTFGDLNSPLVLSNYSCSVPTGYSLNSLDCNDLNGLANPNSLEICNGMDDDCDGKVDEGLTSTFYADVDGDSYGNPNSTVQACTAPSGYVSDNTDCNDLKSAIHPGAMDVCNVVDDDCNGIMDDHAITATVTPTGTVSMCDGSSITLTANNGAGITYQWMKGNSNIAGETNQTYTTKKGASYKVKESNVFGCLSISPVAIVNVNSLPSATINYPTLDLCVQSSITLSANTGMGLTYQWKKADANIPGATNTTYAATATGNYKVVVTSGAGCSKTSSSVSVVKNNPLATITPLSSPDLCGQLSVVLKANAGTGYTYQWKKGSSIILNATNQTYTATQKGSYKVVVTTSGGCSTTSQPIDVTKSCKEMNEGNELSAANLELYPNPTNGSFMVEMELSSEENSLAIIQVINIIGQVVYSENVPFANGQLQKEIHLDEAAGMYLLKVLIDDKIFTKQLVISE